MTASAPTRIIPAPATGAALLQLTKLRAFYDNIECLHGLDLSIAAGEVAVVLGANGAGKTTLLRSICRTVRTHGEIVFDGTDVRRLSADQLVARGIAMVPQGRGTFVDLTVEDNLRAGALTRSARGLESEIDQWFNVFPQLAQRRHMSAGSLSGGEQQMLAIARAMMSHPRLLLLDEPSLGLAPLVTQRLFEVLAEANSARGTALIIVEQNAELALEIAQRGYVLEAGSIAASGTAAQLHENDAIRKAYLGY